MIFNSIFGRKQELLRTSSVEKELLALIKNAKEELWLISPYATFAKLGFLKRQIEEACNSGVAVSVVVRDQKDQVEPAMSDLGKAMETGLELFCLQRLHAKIYWSEKEAILTSLNLVESSFDRSVEVGLYVPSGDLHTTIWAFIEFEILEGAKSLGSTGKRGKKRARKKKSVPKKPQNTGYCIRCGDDIRLDPSRPYCREDYESWAGYGNQNYKDKFCHGCGKKHGATINKPLCSHCYGAS